MPAAAQAAREKERESVRKGERQGGALNYLIAASSDLLELPNQGDGRWGELSRNWISFRLKWKRARIVWAV